MTLRGQPLFVAMGDTALHYVNVAKGQRDGFSLPLRHGMYAFSISVLLPDQLMIAAGVGIP